MHSLRIESWWYFLCAAATFNVLAWAMSATDLQRRRQSMSAAAYSVCRAQLLLSAGYVFGCAFRSAVPVYDIPRLCLFDGWISSVVIGRTVATLAELCFVAQWALLLRQHGRSTGSMTAHVGAVLVLPLIALAETCSWYSVLTTSNAGHVLEECLWGASATLLVAGMVVIRARSSGAWRRMFLGWSLAGTAYAGFMLFHDIPMYVSRWIADQAHGRHYLSIAQGLADISHHRVVSYRWQDWRSEIAWMSLYFSVAVWLSLSLVRAATRQGAATKRPDRAPAMAMAGGFTRSFP